MRSKIWKTFLIVALSSCSGSPPKPERPIKLYSGSPTREAMCRRTQANVAKFVNANARHMRTKSYAREYIAKVMAEDGLECISANAKEFAELVGIPADDLRVMLQYQENLIYKCERWKQ